MGNQASHSKSRALAFPAWTPMRNRQHSSQEGVGGLHRVIKASNFSRRRVRSKLQVTTLPQASERAETSGGGLGASFLLVLAIASILDSTGLPGAIGSKAFSNTLFFNPQVSQKSIYV